MPSFASEETEKIDVSTFQQNLDKIQLSTVRSINFIVHFVNRDALCYHAVAHIEPMAKEVK